MTTDIRRLDGYTISLLCEPNGSGELIMFIYMYIAPGQGQATPGVKFFHLQYYSVNIVLCCKISSIK